MVEVESGKARSRSRSPRNNKTKDEEKPTCRIDKEYFDSYGDLSVHSLMLMDEPRNAAYINAIKAGKKDFEDKIVMDVGTGTGFLAMLCVKLGGAKHVHAVEANPRMARIAKSLVEKNGELGCLY